MTLIFLLVLILFVWHKLRRRARRHAREAMPLAGMDTGTRNPYRAPKGVRFHSGF
jgi:hypothetical protein